MGSSFQEGPFSNGYVEEQLAPLLHWSLESSAPLEEVLEGPLVENAKLDRLADDLAADPNEPPSGAFLHVRKVIGIRKGVPLSDRKLIGDLLELLTRSSWSVVIHGRNLRPGVPALIGREGAFRLSCLARMLMKGRRRAVAVTTAPRVSLTPWPCEPGQ